MLHSNKRTRFWLAGCLILIAGLAAGLWLTYPRERLLTQIARPIAAVKSKEEFHWLSMDRLLIVTTQRDGGVAFRQWRGFAETYDLPSLARAKWPELNNLIFRVDSGPWGSPQEFQPSPAGVCLYWTNKVAGGRLGYQPRLATMDLRSYQDIQYWDGWPSFWLDDSHYVVGHVDGINNPNRQVSGVTIYDAKDAALDRTIPAASAEAKAILQNYARADPFPESELLFINSVRPGDGTLPEQVKVIQRYDSPRLRLSVYEATLTRTVPWLGMLHRLIPSVSAPPLVSEGLWVTVPGAHRMAEIGHVPVSTDKQGQAEDQLEQIKWLPDGKHISFVYHGMLYMTDTAVR
jgi:hypothetical protein